MMPPTLLVVTTASPVFLTLILIAAAMVTATVVMQVAGLFSIRHICQDGATLGPRISVVPKAV
jgi:hypothetical protein